MRREMDEICWSDPPPKRTGLRAKIRRPQAGEALELVCLDTSVTGVWTHWIQNRTKPCRGLHCLCQKKGSNLARRWKGYFMAWSPTEKKIVIAEVTQEAAWSAPELTGGREGLRGARVTLIRPGNNRAGKVVAKVQVGAVPNVKPSPLDIFQALARVWFNDRRGRPAHDQGDTEVQGGAALPASDEEEESEVEKEGQ